MSEFTTNTVTLPTPDPTGGQAALTRWLAKTHAITTPMPMLADGRLAMWNIARGLEALAPLVASLKPGLPHADWQTIENLADLALATAHAEALVDRAEPATSALPALRTRMHELRTQLLTAADLLASFGKLSASHVAEIRKGRGLPDAAQDTSVLSQLFRDNWHTIQGLTPVTKELVEEAGHVGAQVLAVIKPGGGKGGAADANLEALRDQRNRLWTLLVQGHSELSAVAYWHWREEYRSHVPALQGRAG